MKIARDSIGISYRSAEEFMERLYDKVVQHRVATLYHRSRKAVLRRFFKNHRIPFIESLPRFYTIKCCDTCVRIRSYFRSYVVARFLFFYRIRNVRSFEIDFLSRCYDPKCVLSTVLQFQHMIMRFDVDYGSLNIPLAKDSSVEGSKRSSDPLESSI